MRAAESSFVHFLRSFVLLATLIVVPGVAICWNNLPKWAGMLQASGQRTHLSGTDILSSDISSPDLLTANIGRSLTDRARYSPSEQLLDVVNALPGIAERPDETRHADVPFRHSPHHATQTFGTPQHVNGSTSTQLQDFTALQDRLKSLGATYYQLEKWGSQGELFRFVCLVSANEQHTFEKHFQAIGRDPISVMQSVIAEIEAWRNEKKFVRASS